jgi:anaerobic magnesium-protoporphyrin IX monomethyl ester cyclase
MLTHPRPRFNVCLVRAPQIMPSGSVMTQKGVPSIGIAYLSSSLKAAGYGVTVVDAQGEALDRFTRIDGTPLLINGLTAADVASRIPEDVDCIGVSCMYSNEWLYTKVVVQEIARRFPHIPIVGGGEHFTADPEYSLKTAPELRCVVLGEGEDTLVELVEALSTSKPLGTVNGLAYLEDGRFVQTPTRARIRSVDDIPEPSWDEMPLENYLEAGLGMSSLGGRNMPMIASRGCPYKCTFCSNPAMWTQRWIARDPQRVIDEMKMWIARYRVTHIEFYDLTAIVKREWIIEFCKLLVAERLNITWSLPSGTRTEALDEEVLLNLKRSGCHSMTYAPESGSPATLKRIKKMVDIGKMLRSMEAAVRHGIWLKANMIVGFPGQTKGEVAESFWFMVRMAWAGVHDVAVFPFVPYPGSELFFKLVEDGRIRKDSDAYEAFLAGNIYNEVSGMHSWSEHISDRLIKVLTVGGIAWFYFWQFLFRPQRLAASLGRILRRRPVTMFDKTIDVMLTNFVTRRRKVHVEAVEQLPNPVDFGRIREAIGDA